MMKKSIFAVAVASALTFGAAQAETVLYGSIRYDYNNAKKETVAIDSTTGIASKTNGKHLSNLEDAGSRIGLKGSEDLGNNNTVIYHLEWGFNGMNGVDKGEGFYNRLAYMGLTGDWGTFAAGRQDNPFKVLLVDDHVVDGFNGTNVITSASQRAMTTVLIGNENIINEALLDRVGKVIAYITPDFAGFSVTAAAMMNADLYSKTPMVGKNQQKTIDLWTINANYKYDLGANGAIQAKLGYINGKIADNNSSKAWGLFLGYSQDAFAITASYANGNHTKQGALSPNAPKEKSQGWDLGASFSFGPNYFSTIRANYGENQVKIDGAKDKVKSWAIGFEQKLSTRTRAWVEYGKEDTKYHDTNLKAKNNVISIGMRHDF